MSTYQSCLPYQTQQCIYIEDLCAETMCLDGSLKASSVPQTIDTEKNGWKKQFSLIQSEGAWSSFETLFIKLLCR